MNNFKKQITHQFVNAFLFVCFVLLISAPIVYAAISWPVTPSGETDGGKYSAKLVPSGAVMAFELGACPSGWSAADGTNGHADLRGAFVRGMNGNANGRDSARTLGNYQADSFQGHRHILEIRWWAAPSTWTYNYQMWYNDQTSSISYWDMSTLPNVPLRIMNPVTDTTNGTPRTTDETRPKNVALLYCVKN